jgi:Zn-dependent protease with chaperone function
MPRSEAYRNARRRAGLAWAALVGGAGGTVGAGLAALWAARHLPVCLWLLRAEAPGGWVACWGTRLALAVCAAAAAAGPGVLAGQVWRTARALRGLGGAAGPSVRLPAAQGLRPAVVDDPHPWAVTHGLWRPRVAISTGLLALLGPQELEAVLAHERHHVLRRDPLRLLLARAALAALLWTPGGRALLHTFTEASELAADAFAMEQVGPRTLASALHKIARAAVPPQPLARPAAGIGGTFAARVAQIAAFPRAVPAEALPPQTLWALGAGLGAWLGLLLCASALLRP